VIGTPVYPCDRGMANGPRGYHHFEASPNGIVVCRYCGQTPAKSYGGVIRPSTTAPSGRIS
jgi:hypothetical protein